MDLITEIGNGDVLMLKRSRLVRLFLLDTVSHCALVLEKRYGKVVCEYTFNGYKETPLTTWLENNARYQTWVGKAPKSIKNRSLAILIAARGLGHRNYSKWTGLMVWLRHVLGLQEHEYGMVCSTYVQKVWEEAGWAGSAGPMDPADFLEFSQCIFHVA